MDAFINTKKSKKIFIILILIMLFNFSCPKVVKADVDADERIFIAIESLFFWLFDGVQKAVDKIFLDDKHEGTVSVSAESIIKGKYILMSPNIFEKITSNSKDYYDYDDVVSERNTLRDTISSWYYALRNLAILALMSILVYVAIRMILTTISQDKAKYKTMFKDWLVALCLLFVIHYIMVGILNLSSMITDAIGTSGESYTTNLRDSIESSIVTSEALLEGNDNAKEKEAKDLIKDAMAQTVIYAAMVIMNIIFVVKYVLRALTLIFLVLLAPITCITYPIDKISDGKAQAYDMWFKEFLYQVIIQPFHLLIYVVLIGSAAQLAADNLIYAMLCFGVMIPAEKFIKQMFGFKDKLGSPLGSFAGGALASQLISKAKGGGSKVKNKESDDGSENNSTENKLAPRTVDRDNLMDGETGPTLDNTMEERNRRPQIEDEPDITDVSPDIDELEESNILDESQGDDWHPDLTDEQIDELKSEGLQPGDNEYDMYLANHGLKPHSKSEQEENSKFRKEEDYTDDEKALLEAMEDRDNPKIRNEEDWTGDEYALAQAMEDYRNRNNPEQDSNIDIDDNIIDEEEEQEVPEEDENIVPEDNTPQEDIEDNEPQDNQPQDNQLQNNQPQNRTRMDEARDNLRQATAIHSERMTKKWGSANRKQRWKNRGKRAE